LQQVIQKSVEACNKQVEKVPEKQKGAARMGIYYGKGMILKAMEEMEALPPELLSNSEVMKIRSLGLLETGRTEEAFDISGQLEGMGQQMPNLDWRGVRTICLLMIGDYDSAVHLWDEVSMQATKSGLVNLVIHLSPQFHSERNMNWPLTELQAAGNYYYSFTNQVSSLKLNAALTLIEQGSNRKAGEVLQEILDQNPEVPERGTIAYYLTMIQQKEVDPLPPSERIPVLFAPEPGEAGKLDKK